MASSFIIADYLWQGHKQALLERISGSTYRVTIVRRYKALGEAQEAFMLEIPKAQQDYHRKKIEDYAMKHSPKTTPEKPRVKLAKGRTNAKSNQKTT